MPKRYYVRKFLNRPGHHGGAYVLATVEQEWSELEIADCSRHIRLEFPLDSRSDRSNSIRKAKLLAKVAVDFLDALEAEAKAAEKRS